jgi:DNA-directed RNA polymerase sigma subunit (sigma70/sigma32)
MCHSKIEWEKFEAIAKSKKLSHKEEAMLLEEIRKGNELAIYKLVESWESVILSVAEKYINESVTIHEMMDAGRKALIELAKKEIWNTKREQFSRFGAWCVQQRILALIAVEGKNNNLD